MNRRKTQVLVLLAAGLTLLLSGMMVRTDSNAQNNLTISGRVLDKAGPVEGAVVRIQTTEYATTTDDKGLFTLNVPDEGPHRLTAWSTGYFCVGPAIARAGDSEVELQLVAHNIDDNPGYAWISAFLDENVENPSNCQLCHSGADTLPFNEWMLDAHANSANNPRFLTMYTGTDIDGNQSPVTEYGYSRDYGRFPLAPDMSEAYYGPGYQLDFSGTAGNCAACHTPAAAINAAYSTDPTQVTGVGAEGVACDFCHKIWDVVLDGDNMPYANRPGVLSFEFRRPEEGHQFFAGPYDDVAPGEDTYLPLQQESAFCAPCHFGVFWDTTIYNSYGEWLDSPYSDPETGQTCQDCHMPSRDATHFARPEKGGLERDAATIFSHLMPGAADEELLQDTAALDVQAERIEDEVLVTVNVTNAKAGHHIPTDSPLRQIFVVVTTYDGDGNALELVEGTTLPDWAGDLAGTPGRYYAKILQQLWTEITPGAAYWTHTRILEDTRLAAFEEDTSTYRFAAPVGNATTVEVRLIFRRAFYELIQQKGWGVSDIEMEYLKLPIR